MFASQSPEPLLLAARTTAICERLGTTLRLSLTQLVTTARERLPAVVIVEVTAIRLPAVTSPDARWPRDVEEILRELRQAVGRAPGDLVQFESARLPPQIRLKSRPDIAPLFHSGVEEGWAAFQRLLGADRWHSWSQVRKCVLR